MKTSVILKMTSATSPAPQVVTCGTYNNSFPAWKAFDKVTDGYDNRWYSNETKSDWIKINLGEQKIINCFSISTGVGSGSPGSLGQYTAPKIFTLQGSNDDITYINLKSFTETSWKSNKETKTYVLDKNEKYQYYKLYIASNNGGYSVSIGELDLLFDDKLYHVSQKIKEDVINEIKNTLNKYSDSILLVNIEGDN